MCTILLLRAQSPVGDPKGLAIFLLSRTVEHSFWNNQTKAIPPRKPLIAMQELLRLAPSSFARFTPGPESERARKTGTNYAKHFSKKLRSKAVGAYTLRTLLVLHTMASGYNPRKRILTCGCCRRKRRATSN